MGLLVLILGLILFLTWLGPIIMRADLRREAKALEAKLAGDNRLSLLSALLFTALDLKDRAFQELHRAFEEREPGLLFLKVAPWLDPLRTDPRYGALVEKLGLG